MSQLLPPNTTPLELALANFTQKKLTDLDIPIRDLWSPWRCPLPLLPWLAWAVSVDEWDASWSEQQKRETVASSFKIHAKKGTRLAVEQRLNSLGYQTAITEWHQNKQVMPPYTFWADIEVGAKPVTQNIFYSANKLIDSSKNTRSHLTRLRVATESHRSLRVASATYSGVYCAVGGPLEVIPSPKNNGLDYVYTSSVIYPYFIEEVLAIAPAFNGEGYRLAVNVDDLYTGIFFSGEGSLRRVSRTESLAREDSLSSAISFSGSGAMTRVRVDFDGVPYEALAASIGFNGDGSFGSGAVKIEVAGIDDAISCGIDFKGSGGFS
ncbi:phage tail protein I [Marinagarivorans algicola]|uniref:phage tail protein I n=1 Tax=Marinagarivorans algicola TaxID=1513270 RepID=UPI00373555CD